MAENPDDPPSLELTTSVDLRWLRDQWADNRRKFGDVPVWPVTQPEPISVDVRFSHTLGEVQTWVVVPYGLIVAVFEEYEPWAFWSSVNLSSGAPAGWSDDESTAALEWATRLHYLVMGALKDAQRELVNRHSEALVSVALSGLR